MNTYKKAIEAGRNSHSLGLLDTVNCKVYFFCYEKQLCLSSTDFIGKLDIKIKITKNHQTSSV